jgi:bacteriocin-like protein
MRTLNTNELKAVSGGAARKQDIPAKAPGESYKGPADKNFGPQAK